MPPINDPYTTTSKAMSSLANTADYGSPSNVKKSNNERPSLRGVSVEECRIRAQDSFIRMKHLNTAVPMVFRKHDLENRMIAAKPHLKPLQRSLSQGGVGAGLNSSQGSNASLLSVESLRPRPSRVQLGPNQGSVASFLSGSLPNGTMASATMGSGSTGAVNFTPAALPVSATMSRKTLASLSNSGRMMNSASASTLGFTGTLSVPDMMTASNPNLRTALSASGVGSNILAGAGDGVDGADRGGGNIVGGGGGGLGARSESIRYLRGGFRGGSKTLDRGSYAKKVEVPDYVVNEKQVFRYFGYFLEPAIEPESSLMYEEYRVRKVTVQYYLVDGSISVVEPKEENTGILQGQILRRQKVLKARVGAQSELEYYSVEDLKIGAELFIGGRTYVICDADQHTRDWLNSRKFPLDPPLPIPDDVFAASAKAKKGKGLDETRGEGAVFHGKKRHNMKSFMEARLGRFSRPREALSRFLEHGTRVLRVYAVWDDRKRLFGDIHHYVIHYFLADNTIEVVEKHEMNSGYERFPRLLRRMRVPRDASKFGGEFGRSELIVDTAEEDDPPPPTRVTVDTLRSGALKAAESGANLRRHDPDRSGEYLTWRDLFPLGRVLNIFGHDLFLLDYDPFTKDFMRRQGFPVKEDAVSPRSASQTVPGLSQHDLHQYTHEGTVLRNRAAAGAKGEIPDLSMTAPGGSMSMESFLSREENDSNFIDGICIKTMPKTMYKPSDLHVESEAIRGHGLVAKMEGSSVDLGAKNNLNARLRYTAELIGDNDKPTGRELIIDFHLKDDTLSVFEPQRRNSGIVGGRFLQRALYARPMEDGSIPLPGEEIFYAPTDMVVGNVIQLNRHRFKITGMDEMTKKYHEGEDISRTVQPTNPTAMLKNFKDFMWKRANRVMKILLKMDVDHNGHISFDELWHFMRKFYPNVTKSEVRELFGYLLEEEKIYASPGKDDRIEGQISVAKLARILLGDEFTAFEIAANAHRKKKELAEKVGLKFA